MHEATGRIMTMVIPVLFLASFGMALIVHAEELPETPILFAEDFEDALDAGWEWLREDPEDWRLTDGALEISARPGLEDTARNVLRRHVPEIHERLLAFEVTVAFTSPPTEQYEQAGLAWYADDAPVFKLVLEQIDEECFIIPGHHPTEAMQVRLRMEINVDIGRVRTWYRELDTDAEDAEEAEDATTWKVVVEQDFSDGYMNHIALVTYHGPEDADHWMRFSDFAIRYGHLW